MRFQLMVQDSFTALATAIISSALIAPCLASTSQIPLNLNAVSGLKWKECGELNNHTLECKIQVLE